MVYQYKTSNLTVKDVDAKKGIITGYFASFGTKDSDGDIIHPGAFTRTIDEWGPGAKDRIKHLRNHNPDRPLGEIKLLKEDSFGLYYESQIGTHADGVDFIKMVESNLIKEHSIGFNDMTPNDKRKGESHNNITVVKLYEGSSLTAWGANENTPVLGLKGLSEDELKDRIKSFEKFINGSDATDATIQLCIIQIKQLAQVIETMSSTQRALADERQKGSNDLCEQLTLLTLKHF